jgi:hypothetical protein
MNIIFYNSAHNGDLLFSKSFIKQFCDNNTDLNISYVMHYNSFLFSDINNLNIIIPNNDDKYNYDFNGYLDPIKTINITNKLYIDYINFFKNNFDNNNYTIHNNNIYIKLWIANCTSNYNMLDLECNIININKYYNNIINNININYGFNIKLITNFDLLPNIPHTNIDKFLLLKKSNKIIFNYNYNSNSNINHENNLIYLSQKYNNVNIKLFIGNSLDLECNINNINKYKYINNNTNNIIINNGFNINIISNFNLLSDIPHTNKIIFYYNYNPNSGQNIYANHENNLIYLSQKYNNYTICCAAKPIYNNYNIISMDDLGYVKSSSCENIAKALYCAMNSDMVFSFDIGACFYLCNSKFNKIFKGIWYHVSNNVFYYKQINDVLNNNKFLLLNSDITSYV